MKDIRMEKKIRVLRERYPMPDFIREALVANRLAAAYDARPPYQRNDYIGCHACQTSNYPTEATRADAG